MLFHYPGYRERQYGEKNAHDPRQSVINGELDEKRREGPLAHTTLTSSRKKVMIILSCTLKSKARYLEISLRCLLSIYLLLRAHVHMWMIVNTNTSTDRSSLPLKNDKLSMMLIVLVKLIEALVMLTYISVLIFTYDLFYFLVKAKRWWRGIYLWSLYTTCSKT